MGNCNCNLIAVRCKAPSDLLFSCSLQLQFCSLRLPLRRPSNAPNSIADIIGNEERAASIDSDADGASHRITIPSDKTGQHIDRLTTRPAVREGNENHPVTAERLAIPRAVLADEHPLVKLRR